MNKQLTHFEGLRIIPFGLYTLFITIWDMWLNQVFLNKRSVIIFLTFIILVCLALLIDRYYKHKLRNVEKISGQEAKYQRGTLILLFFIYLLSTSIDATGHFSVSILGLAASVIMVIYWWQKRSQYYYIFSAAFIALLSLLPLLFSLWHMQLLIVTLQYKSLVQLLIGLGLIVIGVGDHLSFVHLLRESKDAHPIE